jgi:hypothetical protein
MCLHRYGLADARGLGAPVGPYRFVEVHLASRARIDGARDRGVRVASS